MLATFLLLTTALLSVDSCLGLAPAAGQPHPPFNLKCEGNTVGLSDQQLQSLSRQALFATDNRNPRLSWTITHSGRAAYQKAFRVVVASDPKLRTAVVWDSGVRLGEDNSVRYSGVPLRSGSVYFWSVQWWDQTGKSALSVETGCFLTGVLDPREWEASKWITAPSSIAHGPMISTMFAVDQSSVSKAILIISGLGFFKVSVNGQDLNARLDTPIALTPGWTNYEARVPYNVYEITDEVKQSSGQASIDVILGMAWRNTSWYPPRDPPPTKPDNVARVLRVVLNVTYINGTVSSVVSDENWDCAQSPFMHDSIYGGETYDARVASRRENSAKAVVTSGPNGVLYLPTTPYIAKTGMDKAIKIYRLGSDKQIVDFGNNSAGWCQLKVKGLASGTTVQLHHAEVPLHPPYGPANGSLYYANLRKAKQTDVYTSSGSEDVYEPSLTYHGFRYVEVSGFPDDLTADDISKVVVHSNVQTRASLNTSSKILNQIQDIVVRGQLSNLMSVPTDCDQRNERLGWMGDAGLSSDSMALNFQMEAFFGNFLQLIKDEQIDGAVPDVVPFYLGGRRPADPSWGAALPQIVWVLYKYYGDLDVVKAYLPTLVDYINFMKTTIPPEGIGGLYAYYGDWVPPPPHPKVNSSFTSAFSLLNNVHQVIELANAVNDTIAAAEMKALSTIWTEQFQKAFLKDGMYLNGLQITYVLPLYLGIVPKDIEDDFVKTFLSQLAVKDHFHITAGIVGTKFILPVLSQLGHHDFAMEIAQQVTYPSWGFMIYNPYEPATTVWELWNAFNGSDTMDSRNHHMFSSVSGWMMTDMVGLSQPKESYGFQEIHFHPARILDLSHASVSIQHPKPIKLSWKRSGGIQCAKNPETRSSLNPGLPKGEGLKLSCGEDGGVISEVLFASFGNPTGTCGWYRRGSCHAENSAEEVKKLCLGKSSCEVPTSSDFWGRGCSAVPNRWLSVAVQCQSQKRASPDYKFSSIRVELDVPVGSKGVVFLPAHGKSNLKVWEGEKLVWGGGKMEAVIPGVLAGEWLLAQDSLRLDLVSGSYVFTARGEDPGERRCVDSRVDEKGQHVYLGCNFTGVITSIDWASYGHPDTTEDSCFSHTFGGHHAGTTMMVVKKRCLGRRLCTIPMKSQFFGSEYDETKRLIVEYTCNKRF